MSYSDDLLKDLIRTAKKLSSNKSTTKKSTTTSTKKKKNVAEQNFYTNLVRDMEKFKKSDLFDDDDDIAPTVKFADEGEDDFAPIRTSLDPSKSIAGSTLRNPLPAQQTMLDAKKATFADNSLLVTKSILGENYTDEALDAKISEIDSLYRNTKVYSKDYDKKLAYGQGLDSLYVAKNTKLLANTQMPGTDHSILDEMQEVAAMEKGDEKDKRKSKIKREMAGLGIDMDEYALYSGDADFDLGNLGGYIGNSFMAGLAGFNKGVSATADVLLGGKLAQKLGWENNPISAWNEWNEANYNDYKYKANLRAQQLSGDSEGGWQFGSEVIEGAAGALPTAIMALMSAGASVGGTAVGSTASASSSALSTKAAYESGNLLTKAGITTSSIAKNPQFWTSFARTYGQDYEQAKDKGANDFTAAVGATASSLINGVIELGLDGGSGIQGLPNKVKNGGKEAILDWAISAAEEGGEEMLQSVVSNTVTKFLYDDEQEIFNEEELLKEGIMGTLVGGALGGGQIAVQGAQGYVANQIAKEKASQLNEEEQTVVSKLIQDKIAEAEKNGEKVTNSKVKKWRESIVQDMEKGYISTDTIEEVLGGDTYKTYKDNIDNEDALQAEYDKLYNLTGAEKSDAHRDRQAELKKQLDDLRTNFDRNKSKMELSDTVFDKVKDSRLSESYNELARRHTAFEADLSKYDEKQQTTIKNAIDSGFLNNTNRTHEFVDWIAKQSAGKGVLFDFLNNQKLKESSFAVDGKFVNGYFDKKSGTIGINMDSAKALNTVVGHEITHVLEGTELYDKLKTTIIEHAKSKGDYQGRIDVLSKLYDAEDIESELVADLVGDYLFTDEAFIKNLSANHRNVFQKIYDEVKYLLKVATAGSKEARELEKVKRAFEKAYQESQTETNEATDAEVDDVQYSVSVTDKDTLDSLNEQVSKGEYDPKTNPNGGYYVTYKSMSFWGYDKDGNAILRSPMAEYVDGELSNAYLIPKDKSKLNWYQATETIDENTGFPSGLLVKVKKPGNKSFSYLPAAENQDLIAEDWSNLYFNLKKKVQKNGKWVDSDVPARYNPYEHSSNSMLNDQFSTAYLRDNLVTVKMYVPVSEDNGTFRAKWSKDATGWTDWKSGTVAGKINKQKDLQRRVFLSRYAAPVEIVSDSEVAQAYKGYLEGTDVAIPDNVVSPALLAELKKAGVPITESGKVKYSLSEETAKTDKDYLDAVNRGDMETVQRMVDGASKNAGYAVSGYHGTTNLFFVFDTDKSNIENDWGRGIYATTSEEDAQVNYASEDGADLTNRIERLAEMMENWEEYEDMDYEQRVETARKQLSQGMNNMLHVAFRMENPVIVERGTGGTFFTYESEYDEDLDEYSEPSGTLIDVIDQMKDIIYEDYEWASYDADSLDNLYDDAIDNGGLSAIQLQSLVSDYLVDVYDEDGNLAANEILRAAFERMGFDGIVDKSVPYKFGALSGKRYGGMRGVTEGTTHFIAFNSSQVKLTDPVTYDDKGNVIPLSERFNPNKTDIRYSLSDDTWSKLHEMQLEVNRLTNSIMEFEKSDSYKDQMKKISQAVDSGNIDAGIKEYQQWLKESGLEYLTNKRNALRDELAKLQKSAEEERVSEALQEERAAIEKSGLSEADYFRKQAVKEFGYTPYFYDAGYITTNGKMLNFSGEKGQHFGSRGQDHRAIGVIYAETEGTDALNRFVNDGNIRIVPESPGFDVSATIEPTKEQYATIRKFVYEYANKGYFSIDFSDKDGRVVGSLEYENHINPTRIISDMKHYYATGEIRQPSSLEGFRWSLSPENMNVDNTAKIINQSMTMQEAKRMLETTFKVNGIAEYFEGEYANAEDWLKKAGSGEVEMYIENDMDLYKKYIASNEDILNDEYRISDVLDAYLAGTLTGKAKPKPTRLDVSQSTKLQDNRFYSPQKIEDAKATFELAKQKAVGKDANAINRARAEILLFAHNKGAAELLGVTQAELNKKLRSWSNYSAKARNISERINVGVADENRWTGIENSAYISKAQVTNEDIERLVAEVEGDSTGYERKYIARVMLAADTHIDYSKLNFKFASNQQVNSDHSGKSGKVLGFYDDGNRLIEVSYNSPNTVAHEMGHYIDAQWGRDLIGTDSSHLWLTQGINKDLVRDRYGEQGVQFINNFNLFMDSLSDVSSNYNSYYNNRGEIFARFFAKFVEWTDNIATGNKYYSYESTMYGDKFTNAQYIEFAKLLQEKALLDGSVVSADSRNSLSAEDAEHLVYGNYNIYGDDIALETEDDIAPAPEDVSQAETVEETAETEQNVPIAEDVAPVTVKPTPTVLYNVRDGKKGWGNVYATAQEALIDAVRNVDQELWNAFNEEFDNTPQNTQLTRGSMPITNALIAVQEDVRQETITPIQGAQLLSEAYSRNGVAALRQMVNLNNGNLYQQYLDKAKQYESVVPVTEELFPDDFTSAQQELDYLYAERDDIKGAMDVASAVGDYATINQLMPEYDEVQAKIAELETADNTRLSTLDEADMPPVLDNTMPADADEMFPDEINKSMRTPDPFEWRDMNDARKRNVTAYMEENPAVKPFFQDAARGMLGNIHEGMRGQRFYSSEAFDRLGNEGAWTGQPRVQSPDVVELLDNYGFTYDRLETALNEIIDGNVKLHADAKTLEFFLDNRLRNGFESPWGEPMPASQEYLDFLKEQEITERINQYATEAFDGFMQVADQYAPDDDIAPAVEEKPVAQPVTQPVVADKVAPREEYEAIRPKPKKQPKMVKTTPEEQAQIAKILAEEPTPAKRGIRAWAKFKAAVLDKGAVFEDLSLRTKNRELIGKWNFMLSSEARAQRLMANGTEGVKSLKAIIEEVNNTGKTNEFYEYLYHRHNVDRMTLAERYENTPNKAVFGDSVTAERSQKALEHIDRANPKFKRYAQDVYNYTNYLRQLLVDNGVISQETADLWADMYPHYVPIRRAGDTGLNINVPLDTNKTGVNAPVKKATGGSRDILPLFDTLAMRTVQTYKAIAKNSFGVELKNTLGSTVANEAQSVDGVIDSIDNQDSLLQEGKFGNNPTFTVFENGEKVTFQITKDMYDALKPTSEGLAMTIKPLNVASNFHRGLLTEYNPVFMLTNAIKDVQDVLMNSQHPARTYLKIPEAYAQMFTKGHWYTEYMENGGEQNTYFDKETNTFDTKNKGLKKLLDIPPLSTISKLNNFIEMTPRLAEYIASREAGRSIEVSMLDAARVTTNFAAGGDVTKFLNRNGATFLNASVQGAMQQVRNVREAKANGLKGWASLAAKFTLAGLPALLLNNLVWDDDEDYEELSDYVKQNYYVVWKYGDGQFVRIPKGRTVAVIQNAFEQVSNAITGDDEVDMKTFLELVVSNLAPNNPVDNNILSPIIQVARNETWYGEDLVPTRLQDRPAAEQYDESTDSISKWLGEKLNVSPIKINYLLNQYTGGVGDTVLPMLTPEAERGNNSVLGNVLAPAKDKFSTDSVMNNQTVSDFYDTIDELTTNAKASTATTRDILMSKYMNSVSAEISKLYEYKRGVQNSDYPDDVKYELVRNAQKEIVELMKASMDTYQNIDISGEYAIIGDRYFQKNDEGEWTKLSDEQVTKYKVTTAAGDAPYATDGTNHYRWYEPDEDSDAEPGWRKITDQQLEKQEEVTSGLGISPEEYWGKKEEYDYAYEHPENYAVAKAVGGYDAYRSYSSELYDIKADKDAYGKSISGSRKEKVLDYINNLDADYGEKIILFKSEYPADDTYNYEIIDYLNSRDDISYEEMISILKKLGFYVSADGVTITWD